MNKTEVRHSALGFRAVVSAIVRATTALDVWVLTFAVLLSLTALLDWQVVHEWPIVLLNSLFLALAVMVIAATRVYGTRTWLSYARILGTYCLIPVIFKTAEKVSLALHGHDFDNDLIAIDRLLFGLNPTDWLLQHIPPAEWLVTFLQISYFSFYFLPFALLLELFRRRLARNGQPSIDSLHYDELEETFFIIVYGFCLSYVGYCLYPAVGPRFTLHDFTSLSRDLPGWWPTDWIRTVLNAGENIKTTMTSEEARRVVTRDACPSGHTEITALTMLLAHKFKAKSRWWIYFFGSALIVSTVYLRYHYVIDVIGGLVLVPVTLYTWEWARAAMLKIRRAVIARV